MNKQINTPCYTVHLDMFENNCRDVMDAFNADWDNNVKYGYSVKTNHDAKLMQYAHDRLGWFIETVSPDEYEYACSIGTSPKDIILNGPCKTYLLNTALYDGAYVNLDNLDEVEAVCEYVQTVGNAVNQSRIGIRVNFNLEKICPGETTAGESVSRFGICCENGDFGKAVEMLRGAGIEPAGLHLHVSTRTRSLAVFEALAVQAVKLAKEYDMQLEYVDIGGGFFGGQKVEGKPSMQEYAMCITSKLREHFSSKNTTLILEPGASVLATCVTYETSVISVRDVRGDKVVTVDGTLLHVNPFMVHRNQPFVRLQEYSQDGLRIHVPRQIVCGCTCMENDRFATLEADTELCVGDVLSFMYAGAYTMAFNSNFIILPAKVVYTGE